MKGIFLFLLITTVTCLPKLSLGAEQISLSLKWIDANGNPYVDATMDHMAWVWEKVLETDKTESPALQISLTSQLPPGWKLLQMKGDGVKVVEPPSGQTQSMVVDLFKSRATLRVEFTDENQNPFKMSLVIQATTTQPVALVRPECTQQDLHLYIEKGLAQNLFVGLNCIDHQGSIDVYFFRSNETTWNPAPGLIHFDPENKFSSFKYHFEIPLDQAVPAKRLYRVGILDENQKDSIYTVYYSPKVFVKEKPKRSSTRFSYSAGLGTSYYHYRETLVNLTLNELGLTGKVSVGYRLTPKVMDLAFNMFGTLFSLYHSPSSFPTTSESLPSARFYGVNGRVGYHLPFNLDVTEFILFTGWFFWGMSVPTAASGITYGVKRLNGPQLFLQMQHFKAEHVGYWAYIKYALIANQLQLLTGSNRELAIGGGVGLSKNPKPYYLTLDISQAKFSTTSNSMSLLSYTLGVQKMF